MKKILIVDDHTIVRKGVVSLIKENFPFFETEEAESASDTIRALNMATYDLLILDLNLPDSNVEKLLKQVKAAAKNTPIIVFSMFPMNVMEQPMLKLGASKYVNKGDDLRKLRRAIEEIILGRFSADTSLEACSQLVSPFAELTPKELSVMIGLFDGKSNKEIAEELGLSASTIATYKQRLLEKTKVNSMAELIKIAIQFNVYGFLKQE